MSSTIGNKKTRFFAKKWVIFFLVANCKTNYKEKEKWGLFYLVDPYCIFFGASALIADFISSAQALPELTYQTPFSNW